MMNRAATRLVALRRVFQQKRNSGGHHDVVNAGPPVTLDYMPVPFQSYQKVYGELQTKFNTYLIISGSLLAASFATALYYDIFQFEATFRAPKSYRNRNN